MTKLVDYRQTVVTPDCGESLRQLELAAKSAGVRLEYHGVTRDDATWAGVLSSPGPLGLPPQISMRPSGREVYLKLQSDPAEAEVALGVLWGLAVPLGFVPWDRYPVQSGTSTVFHYVGPWKTLVSFLHGEGRGEYAWPSLCAASQVDVGTWTGDRPTERTVQTHLHRLGVHCGPVNGVIDEAVLRPLRALGLGGKPMNEVAKSLTTYKTQEPKSLAVQSGNFTMKGDLPEVFTEGGVHATLTKQGAALTVDGPGKLILVFGGG